MTHLTCRLTAKNPDQLRNSTLGNRVWATFTFYCGYWFEKSCIKGETALPSFDGSDNTRRHIIEYQSNDWDIKTTKFSLNVPDLFGKYSLESNIVQCMSVQW